MSILDDMFPNRAKKKEVKELSRPATKADLDRLRIELKETPEEKEELAIYSRWMNMSKEERKNKWNYLNINQRNRLSRIIAERSKIGKQI